MNSNIITSFFLFFKVYLKETETALVGEGQREAERESQAGSVLPVQSLMQGSNP